MYHLKDILYLMELIHVLLKTQMVIPLAILYFIAIDFAAASYACDMFGCSVELMEQCLTKRSVETSKEIVLLPLSKSDVINYSKRLLY